MSLYSSLWEVSAYAFVGCCVSTKMELSQSILVCNFAYHKRLVQTLLVEWMSFWTEDLWRST